MPVRRAEDVTDLFGASDMIAALSDTLYGAGDVVWPASLALARLLAHCPSFSSGRRVLELGAGLGLAGSACASAGAAAVLFADRDAETLALAARSAALNAPQLAAAPGGIATRVADWSDASQWADAASFDFVVGSDILYDASSVAPVSALLARVLKAPGAEGQLRRAMLADAPQRLHRDAFVAACAAHGLTAAQSVIPGPEGTVLLNVVATEE
jgi:predicted nicotinamide N-methyase